MKGRRLCYILAFAIMFMMGFTDGLRGPLIPGIRYTFGIDYTSVGTMLFFAGLGFLTATFFGGLLCDKYGQKKVLIFGFICIILGIAGISNSSSFVMFLLMMGLLNIGLGASEISANSLVSIIFVKNQAILMNLLHFFYGVGASIGPRYSGELLNAGLSWQRIYLYALSVVGILLIYMVIVRFPERKVWDSHERVSITKVIRNKRVLLFGAALGFYVACELGISNWFVNYLTVVYRMEELKGATFLSLFFITFTAGRLVGGFIAEKLGYLKSVIIFMSGSLLLFAGGILLGEQYIFLISLCGLSFSIVFPTLVSVIIKEFKASTTSILGFAVTMGSGINMLLNWLIGMINDSINVQAGFMSVSIFIVIVIIIAGILKAGEGNVKKELRGLQVERGQ